MRDTWILHAILLAGAALAGLAAGWLLRSRRAESEQLAIDADWQEQLEARRAEHRRLAEQNRALMEQSSQHHASQKDATNRARELATALKEAFQRRDELQRQIKDIRGNLEAALAERRRLQSNYRDLSASDSHLSAVLKEKDEKIFRMSRELDSWQNRLPPLLQRFRDRNDEAKRLERALDVANERIFELETGRSATQTHVETVRRDVHADELTASNDAHGDASGLFASAAPVPGPRHYVDGGEHFGLRELEAPGRHDMRDDLQAIKGVGPAIEKTLHELGIFNYSQIAEMSEFDINRVAERLKGFRSRIYREDWIGQARELIHRRGLRTH